MSTPPHEFLNLGQHKCVSARQAFASMLSMHEETLNAWTMVFGLVVSMGLYYWISPRTWLFKLLMLSVLIHVPVSFTYHTMLCVQDPALQNFWFKLDILMTFASSLVLIFIFTSSVFGFGEAGVLVFMTLGALIFGLHLVQSWGYKCKNLLCKVSVAKEIAAIVILYLVPLLYGFFVYGNMWGLMAVICVVLGGVMYALQVPERWVSEAGRNRITMVGNSHQLMHILLVVAHVCEFFFVMGL